MSGHESMPGGREAPPNESASKLAIVTESLRRLSDEGRIHYVGTLPTAVYPKDHTGLVLMAPEESIHIYVGLAGPLPQDNRAKGDKLAEAAAKLGEQIGVVSAMAGWGPIGDAECGKLNITEQIGTRNVRTRHDITFGDLSKEMDDAIELVRPDRTQKLLRHIQVRVFEDKATAELEHKLYSGEIHAREYRRLRRHQRYPRIGKVFDALSRRIPQQAPN